MNKASGSSGAIATSTSETNKKNNNLETDKQLAIWMYGIENKTRFTRLR